MHVIFLGEKKGVRVERKMDGTKYRASLKEILRGQTISETGAQIHLLTGK